MASDTSPGPAAEPTDPDEPPARARMTMHYRRGPSGRIERVWAPDDEESDPNPAPASPTPTYGEPAYGERSYGASDDGYSTDHFSNDTAPRRMRSGRVIAGLAGEHARVAVRSRQFIVVLVVAVLFATFQVIAHLTAGHNTTTPTTTTTAAPNPTLGLGQPASFEVYTPDPTASEDSGADTTTQMTVTPTRVIQPATVAAAPDVNAVVQLTVCAGQVALTPSDLLGPTLAVNGSAADGVIADVAATSAGLNAEVQPGGCVTGTEGFDIPGGAKLQDITLLDNELGQHRQFTWND